MNTDPAALVPPSRNVRKLLARLNPKVAALNRGAGGAPLETAIDIAGGVGMAGAGMDTRRFAVDVLCLRWWPGMFEGVVKTVGHRREHRKPAMHDKLVTRPDGTKEKRDPHRVLCIDGCCVDLPIEAAAETPAFTRIRRLIEACILRRIDRDREIGEANLHAELRARIHAEPVPRRLRPYAKPLPDHLFARVCDTYFLEDWARLVITEYRNPNHCQSCVAWGKAGLVPLPVRDDHDRLVDIEWRACETCLGQGVTPWSSHKRAKALRIGNHPFRDFLKAHHDGALSLLRTFEDRGARELLKRLSDER